MPETRATEPLTAQPALAAPAVAPVTQLAYCSQPSALLDKAGFQHMMLSSIATNAQRGITGVLVSNSRLIIQWIEGEESVVQALWRKIEQDTRHHSIVVLHQSQALTRSFEGYRVKRASRNEMAQIVREAQRMITTINNADALPEQVFAIRILSILLDPGLADFYASSSIRRAVPTHA